MRSSPIAAAKVGWPKAWLKKVFAAFAVVSGLIGLRGYGSVTVIDTAGPPRERAQTWAEALATCVPPWRQPARRNWALEAVEP